MGLEIGARKIPCFALCPDPYEQNFTRTRKVCPYDDVHNEPVEV